MLAVDGQNAHGLGMKGSPMKNKKVEPESPLGMQNRIPSGEAASGSDGLFEAVIAYHETGPSSLSGKRNDKKHVVAINERF
jgi:hypothetical protein